MLFNSIEFAIFLPVVFALYWALVKSRLSQNILLLVASYIFYGWWDWRFLSLILLSTFLDYFIGLRLSRSSGTTKKLLLSASILFNLGVLGFFKYWNFFIENFVTAFTFFGTPPEIHTLNIILPVGISFYTFQTMSYSIDIYRGHLKPSKDFIGFATFVSFFPQLVAGPIERATNLLPQFDSNRKFNRENATEGLRQILWGLFKKMVIADSCAIYVNDIFAHSLEYNGFTLFFGAILFSFQIYGDFSGYSDIAIGTARLFGFKLMQNFAYPYFSRDIGEFWRRWHISLSTWFRDYLYIPLGGSRGNSIIQTRNTFAIFLVSGFWHGANWTFIAWGLLNAIYFLPLQLMGKNRKHLNDASLSKASEAAKTIFQIGGTFLLTTIAWILFRANDIDHAFQYVARMVSTFHSSLSLAVFRVNQDYLNVFHLFIALLIMLVIEWRGRKLTFGFSKENLPRKKISRWMFYIVLTSLIIYLKQPASEFIYFAF